MTAEQIASLETAFRQSDAAWLEAGFEAYGASAKYIMGTSFGRGEPGTALRAAWDARTAASDAWTNAKQFA